jgi:copper chaperone NosL
MICKQASCKSVVFIFLVFALLAGLAAADETDPCSVAHPLAPPDAAFQGQCPNCGMVRAMWARTWMIFENSYGRQSACSFHCLADMAVKSGEPPLNVRVALYLAPSTMVPAETAFFVVGSRARGTMTGVSKPAFATRAEASRFAAACGGEIRSFPETLKTAMASISGENRMIARKRLKKGKIVEPVDFRDECAVCSMYPARYPKHRCQIHTRGGRVFHFCSTRCLFEFMADPAQGSGMADPPQLIWVTDYSSGAWISGRTAFYVIGARALGPMGYEAFAFDRIDTARAFAREKGGSLRPFSRVDVKEILSPP